jgi:hypothetical protein
MLVNTKRKCVLVKIVNRVEMFKECITYQEQVLVLSWESALVDNEVTFLMAGFIKVLFWVDFKNVIRHLETNWFNFWSNVFA